ncbi:hypothetical protein FA13DRAFT_1741457, partial [Coprinellus micaceus]
MSTSQIKNRWGGERFPSTVTRWPYYRRPWGPLLPPDGTRCSQLVGLVPGGRMIAEYYTADGPVHDPSEATMCAASEKILRVLVVLCTGACIVLVRPRYCTSSPPVITRPSVDVAGSDIRPPLIRGNHVILSSNQSVLLWEYTKGRVARWTVPRVLFGVQVRFFLPFS